MRRALLTIGGTAVGFAALLSFKTHLAAPAADTTPAPGTASSSTPASESETLAAQSAKIDAVSGASYTSAGYIQSLQSALDQAKA